MAETFDLAFRGGAVKGVAFIGALKTLVAAGHSTRRLVGTSAGAFFAACHAAGYTPAEMEKKVQEERDGLPVFASFVARPREVKAEDFGFTGLGAATKADLAVKAAGRVASAIDGLLALSPRATTEKAGGKVVGLLVAGAACDDEPFRKWLTERLAEKLPKGEAPEKVTLRAFHKHINRDPKKPQQLTLIATDITEKEVLVLNERTAPGVPLVEAVRMSMGIPFAWDPIKWRKEWGSYFRRPGVGGDVPAAKVGNLVVDGGVLSNFPIRYLLDPRHRADDGVLGPEPSGRVGVIGLFLDAQKAVPEHPSMDEPPGLLNRLPAVRYASLLLDTLTDSWDADALRALVGGDEKEKQLVCRIGTKGFSWLEFDLPYTGPDGKPCLKHLITSGECAMREFLTGLGR